MKARIEWLVIGVALGGLTPVACNKSNDREAEEPKFAETGNQTAGDMETSSATTTIAESRCRREERCENIGANKKYSSVEDCKSTVRNDWREELNARECPGGVNGSQLEECLTEIKNEDCGVAIDTLERISACAKSRICEE